MDWNLYPLCYISNKLTAMLSSKTLKMKKQSVFLSATYQRSQARVGFFLSHTE